MLDALRQIMLTPSQEDTSEAFQEMSAAYELLSNPARRKEYDRKQGVTKLGFFVDVVSMRGTGQLAATHRRVCSVKVEPWKLVGWSSDSSDVGP